MNACRRTRSKFSRRYFCMIRIVLFLSTVQFT